MSTSPNSTDAAVEDEFKPQVPPLQRDTFDRRAHRLSPLPDFAPHSAVFNERFLPSLPYLYDAALAEIITSEPPAYDGNETQTWDTESKYTIYALARRGRKYLETIAHEKVQELAPGPEENPARNNAIVTSIMRVETLALLACTYSFPTCKSLALPINRVYNHPKRIDHAARLFTAYIGAMRIPYTGDPQRGADISQRLDRYLDDLLSPRVWVQLDDLEKQRRRGGRFGQQQLLNPGRKSLLERMHRPYPPPRTSHSSPLAPIENIVQTTSPMGPSLLNSPFPSPFVMYGRPGDSPMRRAGMSDTPTRPSSSIGPMRGSRARDRDQRRYDTDPRGGPGSMRSSMGSPLHHRR